MKRLACAALMLLASTAGSAAQGWTGNHIGATGGYGWGHSDQTDPGVPMPLVPSIPSLGDGHFSASGGLVGAAFGRDWQNGPWVYGAEADLSWADIKGQSDVCGPTTVTPHPCGTKLDALGTFRGRLGYTFGATGNWLVYATGGLALGDVHGWDSLTPASGSEWRAGWTAGLGVEAALAPHWSAKLEYLHVDLGNGTLFDIVPGVAESVSFRSDIIRAGINYRFDDPPAGSAQIYTKAPKLYAKAPPVAADPWSGWYAGLNAGYIDGSSNIASNAVVTSAGILPEISAAMAATATNQLSTGNGGVVGGAQVGVNYLLSPTLLAGLEADFQASSLRGSGSATSTVTTAGFFPNTITTGIAASRSLDYIGTVRARLGARLAPSLLLYATGGLAYGGVRSSTTVTQSFVPFFPPSPPANISAGSFSNTRAGYTVGAGGEWMFLSNWSAKLEYLYYDLGSANYGTGVSAIDQGFWFGGFGIDSVATSSHVRFNGNIVRAGINYHFN